MASVYDKNGILYVSWWDPNQNKTQNRSMKMKATVANRKTANDFAKKLQKGLDKQKDENGNSLVHVNFPSGSLNKSIQAEMPICLDASSAGVFSELLRILIL